MYKPSGRYVVTLKFKTGTVRNNYFSDFPTASKFFKRMRTQQNNHGHLKLVSINPCR